MILVYSYWVLRFVWAIFVRSSYITNHNYFYDVTIFSFDVDWSRCLFFFLLLLWSTWNQHNIFVFFSIRRHPMTRISFSWFLSNYHTMYVSQKIHYNQRLSLSELYLKWSTLCYSRLGATVGHLTQVPRAVLNNPRVHMAHLDRTHRGTHRQDPQEHLTHDRLSHHTRFVTILFSLSN